MPGEVPQKTARRIAELLDTAGTLFDATATADVAKAVLFFVSETVGSKKFPKKIELHAARSLAHEFFSALESERPEVAAEIDDLAEHDRFALRYGERTKIARDPGCVIL